MTVGIVDHPHWIPGLTIWNGTTQGRTAATIERGSSLVKPPNLIRVVCYIEHLRDRYEWTVTTSGPSGAR